MAEEWNTYIDQILNKYDFDTNEVLLGNVCTAAAIYGHDGQCWAYSAAFPELLTYDFAVEGFTPEDTENVNVNEVYCAQKAADGERKPAGAAGVRLGNVKYMFVKRDDTTGVAQLSCSTGGAACANLKDAVIVAMYNKNTQMGDGMPQTLGLCQEQVGVMHAYLSEQGY